MQLCLCRGQLASQALYDGGLLVYHRGSLGQKVGQRLVLCPAYRHLLQGDVSFRCRHSSSNTPPHTHTRTGKGVRVTTTTGMQCCEMLRTCDDVVAHGVDFDLHIP